MQNYLKMSHMGAKVVRPNKTEDEKLQHQPLKMRQGLRDFQF